MRISDFDKRIRIEKKVSVIEEEGGTTINSWVLHAKRWAQVQDVLPSKHESDDNSIRIRTDQTRIRIFNLSTLTTDMRIVLPFRDDKIYQIVAGPAEMEDRRVIEVMTESFTTAGDGV